MTTTPHPASTRPPRRAVVALLPGQGAQYDRMATGLYGCDPVFTAAMDAVFDALDSEGDRLRADWLTDRPSVPLEHVARSQPLLFAVDHALGRVLLDRGVEPAAMLGHSVGEVAAATLAGVFDVRSATRMMADRVRRIEQGPSGGMVAVAAPTADVEPYLQAGVVVGAVNAPRQTVIAGPTGPLRETVERLRDAGLVCLRTPATSPFHSPALAGVALAAAPVIAAMALRTPSLELWSGYTGGRLPAELACSPGHWVRQPVDPVLFWPALDALLAGQDVVLVETGPGDGLTRLARRHPAVRSGRSRAIAMLPTRPGAPQGDREAVEAALDVLREEGHPVAPAPGLNRSSAV